MNHTQGSPPSNCGFVSLEWARTNEACEVVCEYSHLRCFLFPPPAMWFILTLFTPNCDSYLPLSRFFPWKHNFVFFLHTHTSMGSLFIDHVITIANVTDNRFGSKHTRLLARNWWESKRADAPVEDGSLALSSEWSAFLGSGSRVNHGSQLQGGG